MVCYLHSLTVKKKICGKIGGLAATEILPSYFPNKRMPFLLFFFLHSFSNSNKIRFSQANQKMVQHGILPGLQMLLSQCITNLYSVLQKFKGWAPRSFTFLTIRSFLFFKRNVLFFFEFLATYETQKNAKNPMFFC